MDCATASDIFPRISDSGPLRQADLEGMLDPELKAYLKKEGILITTWREDEGEAEEGRLRIGLDLSRTLRPHCLLKNEPRPKP